MKKKKGKAKKLGGRPAYPTAIERGYATALLSMIKKMRPPILAAVKRFVAETAKVDHADAKNAAPVTRAFAGVQVQLDTIVKKTKPGLLAQGVAKKTAAFATSETNKAMRGVVEIPTGLVVKGINAPALIKQNVALIKSIPKKLLADVQAEVAEAWEIGRDASVLAARIEERFNVSENRARLIARDQIGSINAIVNEQRQKALGVSEFEWSTVRDERVRELHRERDGKTFSYDETFDETDDDGPPGRAINCIPGDALVSLHAPALKAYRRRYSGQLTTIVSDAGEPMPCTPNHPVLTSRGWLPAHLVEVGDDVFEVPAQGLKVPVGDPQRGQTTAQEMFGALAHLGVMHRVVGFASWFHGDAVDEQVDVVEVDRRLLLDFMAQTAEMGGEDRLSVSAQAALALGGAAALLVGVADSALGNVGGGREEQPLGGCGVLHADEHRGAPAARFDASLDEASANGAARDLAWGEASSEFLLADAVKVEPRYLRSRKVQSVVSHGSWTGDVFNFETTTGWFGCHGRIVHNCRCVAIPVLPDLDE